ncbi:MAG: hypothetical protein BJ554DRAFT_3162, partial [Olpidium bornovanus]
PPLWHLSKNNPEFLAQTSSPPGAPPSTLPAFCSSPLKRDFSPRKEKSGILFSNTSSRYSLGNGICPGRDLPRFDS